jgi:hypothetical protein
MIDMKIDIDNLKISRDVRDGMVKYGDTLAKAESYVIKKGEKTDRDRYRANYDGIRWKK